MTEDDLLKLRDIILKEVLNSNKIKDFVKSGNVIIIDTMTVDGLQARDTIISNYSPFERDEKKEKNILKDIRKMLK